MRTALIYHHDNPTSRDVVPAWLDSFSDLCAIVEIHDPPAQIWRRLRFEVRRSRLRLLDVLAFRLYYRLAHARRDAEWFEAQHKALLARFDPPRRDIPIHVTTEANSEATRAFLERQRPDVVLARCKLLLRREVFDVPADGTFVVHPGICPEYRNAHGCFWALACRDLDRVGATLLQIDEGIDTGPVFAYYRADVDELAQSHVAIQHHVVFDNLDRIAGDLVAIHEGRLPPIDTSGRTSRVWGHPRLTDWARWKRAAARARPMTFALLYHDIATPEERDAVGFPGPLAEPYKLTPERFEAHLDAVAASGVGIGLIGRDAMPQAALTFDDGGGSALAAAAALERRGWRGHFFITTGRLGTPGFLDADGVRELRDRGHVVGSHSHTHPTYMGHLPADEMLAEWTTSREVLREILGEPPRIASVPGGFVSPNVIATAEEAGYSLLMTSEPTARLRRHGDMGVLGRFGVWASTAPERAGRYAVGSKLACGRLWVAWRGKAAAKQLSPGLYERLRKARAQLG